MSSFYDRTRATATRLLTKRGQPATIRVPALAVSSGRPWAPSRGAPVDYRIQTVLLDYSQQDRDGTLVQQNDRRALFPAEGLPVITEAVELVLDAESSLPYAVINLLPLNPGGTVLMYEAQVRR